MILYRSIYHSLGGVNLIKRVSGSTQKTFPELCTFRSVAAEKVSGTKEKSVRNSSFFGNAKTCSSKMCPRTRVPGKPVQYSTAANYSTVQIHPLTYGTEQQPLLCMLGIFFMATALYIFQMKGFCTVTASGFLLK